MRRTRLLAALLAVSAAALDQLSKLWALAALADEPIELFSTVRLALFHNDGASFSTGAGNGRVIGTLVIAVIAYVVWMIARHERPAGVLILGVVLGGAIGNLWDRLFRAESGLLTGAVVDFIDVSWFAVFNVADSFVVVGAITFGIVEMIGSRREPSFEQRQEVG